ncbi:MAG: hypothetical protein NZ651_07055 [Candidatus Bipolaricaulota bacterium]|nr:hypothetical protein [Candidatus Bipolaricaulota bacterium]MDW8127511.1 hypothetical protein [Candidatus Bipolaricaulota bacterium]
MPRLFVQKTHWEAEGVAPPVGSRFWQPGQEPPASAFNWFFYATYDDIRRLAWLIEERSMAEIFLPEDFSLSALPGSQPARLLTITERGITVISFPDQVTSSAMVLWKTWVPVGEQHFVTLYWTGLVANPQGRSTVWAVRLAPLNPGDQISGNYTDVVQVVASTATPFILSASTFSVDSPGDGKLCVMWIQRRGTDENDTFDGPVGLLAVEVN